MSKKLILTTRGSPLALKQAELTQDYFSRAFPDVEVELLKLVTTGDRKTQWSLEKEGGKGLFTKELEDALLNNEADLAVHSAKDMPTEFHEGLAIAGFLPREEVFDVMVIKEDVEEPTFIATSSPRRRAQAKQLYPKAVWSEIRGNVHTRLKKIASGVADATILAAAGLNRLEISEYPGVRFKPMELTQMVPAVGQGAIAIQTRTEDVEKYAGVLDSITGHAVTIERKFLAALGGGCHTAFGAHFRDETLVVFHEDIGIREYPLTATDIAEIDSSIASICQELRGETAQES